MREGGKERKTETTGERERQSERQTERRERRYGINGRITPLLK